MKKKIPPLFETEYAGIWYLAFIGDRELATKLMTARMKRDGAPKPRMSGKKLAEYFCGKEQSE